PVIRPVIARCDPYAGGEYPIAIGRTPVPALEQGPIVPAQFAPVVARPLAPGFPQVPLRLAHVAALAPDVAPVAATIGVAQLALLFAQLTRLAADLSAALGRGGRRKCGGGHQAEDDQFTHDHVS